jgi:hypothetical protein
VADFRGYASARRHGRVVRLYAVIAFAGLIVVLAGSFSAVVIALAWERLGVRPILAWSEGDRHP